MSNRIGLLLIALLSVNVQGQQSPNSTNSRSATSMRGVVHMEVPEYPLVPLAALLEGRVRLRNCDIERGEGCIDKCGQCRWKS